MSPRVTLTIAVVDSLKRLTPTGRLEKQTSTEPVRMSVLCQKQTSATCLISPISALLHQGSHHRVLSVARLLPFRAPRTVKVTSVDVRESLKGGLDGSVDFVPDRVTRALVSASVANWRSRWRPNGRPPWRRRVRHRKFRATPKMHD
jgi:hypothetical protein